MQRLRLQVQQCKIAGGAQESRAQLQVQEMQDDLGNQGGACNAHNTRSHFQMSEVWNIVRAEDPS